MQVLQACKLLKPIVGRCGQVQQPSGVAANAARAAAGKAAAEKKKAERQAAAGEAQRRAAATVPSIEYCHLSGVSIQAAAQLYSRDARSLSIVGAASSQQPGPLGLRHVLTCFRDAAGGAAAAGSAAAAGAAAGKPKKEKSAKGGKDKGGKPAGKADGGRWLSLFLARPLLCFARINAAQHAQERHLWTLASRT